MKKKVLPILATVTLTIDNKQVHAQEDGMNPLYYMLCIHAMQRKFEEKLQENPLTPEQAKDLDELVDLMFPNPEIGDA